MVEYVWLNVEDVAEDSGVNLDTALRQLEDGRKARRESLIDNREVWQ
jgi:hypothetical protein